MGFLIVYSLVFFCGFSVSSSVSPQINISFRGFISVRVMSKLQCGTKSCVREKNGERRKRRVGRNQGGQSKLIEEVTEKIGRKNTQMGREIEDHDRKRGVGSEVVSDRIKGRKRKFLFLVDEDEREEGTQKTRNYCERKEYVMRRDVWEAKSCPKQKKFGNQLNLEPRIKISNKIAQPLAETVFWRQIRVRQRKRWDMSQLFLFGKAK